MAFLPHRLRGQELVADVQPGGNAEMHCHTPLRGGGKRAPFSGCALLGGYPLYIYTRKQDPKYMCYNVIWKLQLAVQRNFVKHKPLHRPVFPVQV